MIMFLLDGAGGEEDACGIFLEREQMPNKRIPAVQQES